MTGAKAKARTGFSWTSLLFGAWVPLFRGDWKWAAILFPIQILIGVLTFGVGVFVLGFIMGFKYNEWQINDLRTKGYVETITHDQFFDLQPIVTVQSAESAVTVAS